MDYNSKFKEKLATLLFVPIKAEALEEGLAMSSIPMEKKEEILIPISSNYILQDRDISKAIRTTYIIEGMFYVLGVDRDFRYQDIYKKLLGSLEGADKYIKSKIAEEFKNENYEEAFIYLRGLLAIDKSKDIFINAINIAEILRAKDKNFDGVELELLEYYKSYYDDFLPYYYEAFIYYTRDEVIKAQGKIYDYYARGGEEDETIEQLKQEIEDILDYKKALEYIKSKPEESLKILLERYSAEENNGTILYYIAVAYRNLGLNEKAIYYLNEALAIDNSFIDVVNELGINYAALGDYDQAIEYLRQAFERTRSIDICTNLVMCYYYKNDMENAVKHLRIAEKLDESDEVLKQIKKLVIKEEN